MNYEKDYKRILIFLTIATYVLVFAWLFGRNLTADTDYSFHMNNIMELSKGNWIKNPYLSGGKYLTLAYGAPAYLLGAGLYLLFGTLTVALLMLIAFLIFLHYDKKLVASLTNNKKISELAFFALLLNPFTVYMFITAKLPFVWASCFGLISLVYFFNDRKYPAVAMGVLSVITHPVAIFLFIGAFLLNFKSKEILVVYAPIFTLSIINLLFVWHFNIFGGMQIGISELVALSIFFAVVTALYWARRESRPFCISIGCLSALLFVGTLAGAFSVPFIYFDRAGWLIFLVASPFLAQRFLPKMESIVPSIVPLTIVCAMLITGGVVAYHAMSINDNPEVFSSLPQKVVTSLYNGWVHFANDGSALYELPKDGVRFSNAGQVNQVPNENLDSYIKRIMIENASFVLVYGKSPEENLIENLGWPLIFHENDLKIWRCEKENGQIMSPRFLPPGK